MTLKIFKDVVKINTTSIQNIDNMKLSDALVEWAHTQDMHDDYGVCHCDICQVFAPMAGVLERVLIELARSNHYNSLFTHSMLTNGTWHVSFNECRHEVCVETRDLL